MPLVGQQKRDYQRDWKNGRRAAYLANACCALCGSRTRLQMDHVDRTKKVSHRIWSWSKPRLEAELAKCQWLCFDCHQDKSIRERGQVPRSEAAHGTRARYIARCRCTTCRGGHAARRRLQRGRARS